MNHVYTQADQKPKMIPNTVDKIKGKIKNTNILLDSKETQMSRKVLLEKFTLRFSKKKSYQNP